MLASTIILIVIIIILIVIIGIFIYLYNKVKRLNIIKPDQAIPVQPTSPTTNVIDKPTTEKVVVVDKPPTKNTNAQRVIGSRDASWWKVLDGTGNEVMSYGAEGNVDYDVECEAEINAVGISDGIDTTTGKILGPVLCKNINGDLTIILNADGNDGVIDHYVPIKEYTCPSGYIQKAIAYPNSSGISYICVLETPVETTIENEEPLPEGTCKLQSDCQPDEICDDGKCKKIENF